MSEPVERLGLLRAMLQAHQARLGEKLELAALQEVEILLQMQVQVQVQVQAVAPPVFGGVVV